MIVRRTFLLVATVLLAACSSGGGATASTKADYIVAGDSLCRSFMTDADALGRPTNVDELIALLDKAIPLGDQTRSKLAALTPPEDGAQVQAELLKSLDDTLVQVRKAREAAARGDTAGAAAALKEAARLGKTSDAAAKSYGFTVCGSEAELRSRSSS